MSEEISLDMDTLSNSTDSNNQMLNNVDGASIVKRNSYKPSNRSIILFDGVCNVCDGFVQFVLPRDINKKFYFQALQTEKGKEIQEYYGIKTDLSTVVLVEEETNSYCTKSTAILRVLSQLCYPYSAFYYLSYIPAFFRDFCYSTFVPYRYLIMGKKDTCMFSPSLKERFIDFKSPLILEELDSKEN
ncbi:hypothetical protein CYY_006246 [Polysphondylium violaceum]|uniref:Thiol-disulfide oxidoreductase DCC n=1 Tax=Polysphondylium violaceum TaxID=133409 RepID=A0A8J4V645_9MYCE|nr:hypothetical protein CYY_006246 [Polysphondylium violaceum]